MYVKEVLYIQVVHCGSEKQAENGVTAAFAWDNWRVKFE